MLKEKFFNKKFITALVAGIIVLTLLVVLTATGALHNHEECRLCNSTGLKNPSEITCELCNGTGKIGDEDCTLCEGTGETQMKICADCEGTGIVDGETCETCEGEKYVSKDLCELCEGAGSGDGSFWALIPPIIAIALALITKEVFSSLFIGILSGAILAADFAPLKTMDTLVGTGLIDAVAGTAGIFIFLIELGFLVVLVNKAGGSAAFGNWAQKHIKTKVGAAICTFILGVLIFIDDYFNCLTVGSVMRPVTDKHKISRSKLAYLIDATAAPICMIAPISSWAAAVTKYAEKGQGINLFIAAIPFNFYSILTLVFVLGIILMKFDFGPMKKHEINAENGDLFSGKQIKQNETTANPKGRVFDLIIPIAVLVCVSVFALVYNGGILDGKSFIDAFGDTDATVALPWAGLITVIVTIIYLACRQVVSFDESMKGLSMGFIAMVPAMLILTFATALKNITGELGAAYYVGNLMAGVPETLAKFLPAMIFVVACVLAFATGTSWGTFGILIPIVTAMFTNNALLCTVGISACLAGAVCGDHCSPISDTTIMSSAGAECEHVNHVSTQLPYAIYVAAVSFVCFILAGFITIWYVMLPLSIAIMVGCLIVTKLILNKKQPVTNESNE